MPASTTVSAVAVLDLYDFLRDKGVATEQEMLASGLNRETMIDRGDATLPAQEQRLPEEHLLALWRLAERNRAVPHIGLLAGQTYNPSTRGVLANWLFHCGDIGEAMQVFQRHIALMNPSERWVSATARDSLLLTVEFAPERSYPTSAVERSMSALVTWTRELTGIPLVPTACEFAFPRPTYYMRYANVFGGRVLFDSDRNCIHLPLEVLRRPIRTANAYLKHILEERARQALQKLEVDSEWIGKVRQHIQSGLHRGLGIDDVCKSLHVSRPTLYRRLRHEGTSYTALVAAVRKDLAYKQICQGLPIASVSEELGFKDVSSFHRAFRRWFDRSPGECRSLGRVRLAKGSKTSKRVVAAK
jgi:AraC-like DNA-binding protein